MRALTLTPPWTGPVSAGIKLIENRPQPTIKPEDIGVRFAIHAGREVDEFYYERIREIAPELYDGWHPSEQETWPAWYRLSRITKAVISTARLARIVVLQDNGVDVRDYCTSELVDLGEQRRWFFGVYGYVLEEVVVLPQPVPMRGWQGFWTMAPDKERAVVAQLARVA